MLNATPTLREIYSQVGHRLIQLESVETYPERWRMYLSSKNQ